MSLAAIRTVAERLEPSSHYLLFSHQARFLNPLVERERAMLSDCEALDDEAVLQVVERLDELRDEIGKGLFFPAPLARALGAGTSWDVGLGRFSYEMIRVDEEGRWTWKGGPVAPRTRDFFLEHLRFEPELGRWLFEYRVNDGWWDKSYLDAEISPLEAIRLEESSRPPSSRPSREEAAPLEVVCVSGQRAPMVGPRLRLDARERIFVEARGLGEVQLSPNLRFDVLKSVSEDLDRVVYAGRELQLVWPERAAF